MAFFRKFLYTNKTPRDSVSQNKFFVPNLIFTGLPLSEFGTRNLRTIVILKVKSDVTMCIALCTMHCANREAELQKVASLQGFRAASYAIRI